jgi:hypothetical protein
MSEHDHIPESTQYIDESTVVPESLQAHLPDDLLPESAINFDTDVADDDGLPGGNADGLRKASGKAGGNRTFIIGLAAVVLVVGGGVMFLKHKGAAQQQAAIVAAQEAQVPPPAAPMPSPGPAPMPAASAPVQPSSTAPASDGPGAGDAVALPQSLNQGGAPAAVLQQAPVPAQTAPVASVEKGSPSVNPQSAELRASLQAEQDKSRALEARLRALEEQMRRTAAAGGSNTSVRDADSVTEPAHRPKPAASVRKFEHSQTKVQHQVKPRHVRPKTREASRPESAKPGPEVVAMYRVTAVRNGVAWIDTPSGPTAVRVGDDLEGIGSVTLVDDDRGRVVAGGQTLR